MVYNSAKFAWVGIIPSYTETVYNSEKFAWVGIIPSYRYQWSTTVAGMYHEGIIPSYTQQRSETVATLHWLVLYHHLFGYAQLKISSLVILGLSFLIITSDNTANMMVINNQRCHEK